MFQIGPMVVEFSWSPDGLWQTTKEKEIRKYWFYAGPVYSEDYTIYQFIVFKVKLNIAFV